MFSVKNRAKYANCSVFEYAQCHFQVIVEYDIMLYIAYNTKYYIMSDASTDIKRRIISTLKKEPMSLSELSRRLKLRRDFVSGYLEAMRHEGEVKVIRIGRSKVYRTKKGKRK